MNSKKILFLTPILFFKCNELLHLVINNKKYFFFEIKKKIIIIIRLID